jgi:hypothetical protein
MKPKMNLNMRISIDSSHNQRYTKDQIVDEFNNDNILIERKLVIRKTDGAVLGEILTEKKDKGNILNVISEFNVINKQRNELNSKIREHYEPLMTKAGKDGDLIEFERLMNELPDCPFLLTSYRMCELYFSDNL